MLTQEAGIIPKLGETYIRSLIRAIEFLLIISNWVSLFTLPNDEGLSDFKYFSLWGMLFTWINVSISLFFCRECNTYLKGVDFYDE